MKKSKIKLLTIAVACASAFASQSALADTLKYNGAAYGFISTSGVVTSPSAITSAPAAGGFLMENLSDSVPNDSFLAWCVDVQGWLATSATYNLQTGATFYPGAVGAVKVNDLERLATAVLSSVNTKQESGAFQLAVWEIVNETSGPYDLGAGNFTVGSASDGAYALARTWLTNLGNGTFTADTMSLSIWKDVNNNTQDLAVFAAAPVPEPEIYAMLAAGLGLMGFVARRRRQVVA